MATIEELEGMMAEVWAMMKENEKIRREAEEIRRENEEARKRSDAEAEARRAKYDAEIAEIRKRNEKTSEDLNRWVGRFGNTTGYITEMVLLPGIRKKMDEYGHQFDTAAARKEFYRKGGGGAYTEADLILENGKEVMIVEVETRLRMEDVRDQIERLELLRANEKDARIEGKTLISGVAGLNIDKDAKKMAKERGMYIIQMVETDTNITVDPPETVGCW